MKGPLWDHEAVAESNSMNLVTFNYHCNINRFQFPCFATGICIYWMQGYYRRVIFLLQRTILPHLEFTQTMLWKKRANMRHWNSPSLNSLIDKDIEQVSKVIKRQTSSCLINNNRL